MNWPAVLRVFIHAPMTLFKYSATVAFLVMLSSHPTVHAQAPGIGIIGDLRGAMVIGSPGAIPLRMPPGAAPARAGSVKRLSDTSASCTDLATEVTQLEAKIEQHLTRLDAAQSVSRAASEAMMSSSQGGQTLSTASGMLSMLPGAGAFAGIAGGIASSAVSAAASSNMQDSAAKMMTAQQEIADVSAVMAVDQERRDYLVDLYMSRGCRFDAAPVSARPPSP